MWLMTTVIVIQKFFCILAPGLAPGVMGPQEQTGKTSFGSRSGQMHYASLQSRHSRLRAVADVEATENNIHMPFDRRLADADSLAYFSIASSLNDQLQHFQFARAQLRMRWTFRQTLGDRGGNVLQARMNRADRVDQLVVRHALQNV